MTGLMYQGTPQLHYINLNAMVQYRTCFGSTFRDHDENIVDALILNQTISFSGHNIFFPLKPTATAITDWSATTSNNYKAWP